MHPLIALAAGLLLVCIPPIFMKRPTLEPHHISPRWIFTIPSTACATLLFSNAILDTQQILITQYGDAAAMDLVAMTAITTATIALLWRENSRYDCPYCKASSLLFALGCFLLPLIFTSPAMAMLLKAFLGGLYATSFQIAAFILIRREKTALELTTAH